MPGTWQGRVQRIKAQKAQKRVYDKRSRELNLKAGERVLFYMPKEKASKAYKFAHPFHGSFRVRRGYRVAFDGARRCPTEVQEGASWPSPERERTQTHAQDQAKILHFLYLKRKKFPHHCLRRIGVGSVCLRRIGVGSVCLRRIGVGSMGIGGTSQAKMLSARAGMCNIEY